MASVSTGRADGPGVLVLRNGNVLQGSVQAVGDFYRVESANATLQVPHDQVEVLCDSLEDAYQSRRRTHAADTADSRLELARWCLRQGLFDQASREVAEARRLEPSHPDLSSLDLQLRQLIELRTMRSKPAVVTPNAKQRPAVSSAGEAAFAISAEAQVEFVRSIQPMLVRSCATSGCHQPGGAQRLQLDRWALTGNGNATLIRRNLAAVLSQIHKEDPAASPLVAWGGRIHGGAREPSHALAPNQMRLLNEWLNEACGVAPPPPSPPEGVPPSDDPNDAAGEAHAAPNTSGSPAKARPPETAFVPRDAFDAEIFNRRQAQRAASSAALPSESAEETEEAVEASNSAPTAQTVPAAQ